ncbi:MAG TPA: oxygenase MpaB family protein, partial [Kofleriaceae bacterium]|nr:oxygenase MpaB family protein [Kofleriaceae bacterium]
MPIVTREQHEAALAALVREVDDPRTGILGPRSVAWRLGGDLAVFLGGGRAALLQLAHPMVAFAIDQHSRTRDDVVGRFQRTFRNVFAMVFGELDDALAAARRVHRVHERVQGTIPIALGAWPAGTPYHANDVDALRWVHATLVDTTIVVRERLDGAVAVADKDAYIVELNRFAALFGIPRDRLAWSWAEHAAYMARMLYGDQLAVAPCAREMAGFLLGRSAVQ